MAVFLKLLSTSPNERFEVFLGKKIKLGFFSSLSKTLEILRNNFGRVAEIIFYNSKETLWRKHCSSKVIDSHFFPDFLQNVSVLWRPSFRQGCQNSSFGRTFFSMKSFPAHRIP